MENVKKSGELVAEATQMHRNKKKNGDKVARLKNAKPPALRI